MERSRVSVALHGETVLAAGALETLRTLPQRHVARLRRALFEQQGHVNYTSDWRAPHHTRHSRRLPPSRSRQNLETLRSAPHDGFRLQRQKEIPARKRCKLDREGAPDECTLGSLDVRKNSEAKGVTKRVESEGWKKLRAGTFDW